MRFQTAASLVLSLTAVLACGDDPSTPSAPDAGVRQPGVDAGIAVDASIAAVDAMPAACGEVIAEVSGDVVNVVVDGTRVYWREVNLAEGSTYIRRVDKSGGDVEDVAFAFGFISEFVVDGELVVYADYGGVWAVPAAGGDRIPLSDIWPLGGQIAVHAGRVYWVDSRAPPDGGRIVLARPEDGSTEVVEIVIDFDEEGSIEDLAVDDAGLYFFDGVTPAVMRAPREGGLAEPLGTSGRSTIEELVVSGDHVYWRTRGMAGQGGPVYRAPRDQVSTEEAQLVAELSDTEGIQVHGGHLYAVDRLLGLKRFALDGGGPSGEPVAGGLITHAFVVDEDGIFFNDRQSSSIRAAPLTGCP